MNKETKEVLVWTNPLTWACWACYIGGVACIEAGYIAGRFVKNVAVAGAGYPEKCRKIRWSEPGKKINEMLDE